MTTAGGNADFALARYNTNGTLDTTFGTGGKVTTSFGTGSTDLASGVAVQTDGKIVAAGRSNASGTFDFALARYQGGGVPQPSLTISKTHTANFIPGRVGVYTITVGNNGTAPTNGTTVTVHDALPAGLTAIAITGNGWRCTQSTLTCTRTDVLAAGSNYPPITLRVRVARTATGTVTNTATVSGGGDGTATATDPTVIDPDPRHPRPSHHKPHHHKPSHHKPSHHKPGHHASHGRK